MYLVFQLKTHSEVFDEEDDEDDEDGDDGVAGNALGARNTVAADAGDRDVRISVADGADQHREHRHHTRHAGVAALGVGGLGLVGVSAAPGSDDGGESDPVEALDHDGEPGAGGGGGGGVQVVEENAAPLLSVKAACFWLGVITILISMASDVLVDTLEEAASQYNIPAFAVATIFVPIVGNAAEHWAAVTFASRDKMGLSMAIAVGSSTQVSLFLIPFCVVAGWIMGTEMSLDFHQLQVACVAVAVLLVAQISSHGESTWLSGVLLIATYLVMCAAFWFHCKPDETGGACHVAAAS
jgi:Ca2+/H+ antiporter